MIVPASGQRVRDKETGQLGYVLSLLLPIAPELVVMAAVQWEGGGSAHVPAERLRPIVAGGDWLEIEKVKAPE